MVAPWQLQRMPQLSHFLADLVIATHLLHFALRWHRVAHAHLMPNLLHCAMAAARLRLWPLTFVPLIVLAHFRHRAGSAARPQLCVARRVDARVPPCAALAQPVASLDGRSLLKHATSTL